MAWARAATAVGVVVLAAGAGAAQSQTKQVVTGPVATYWMSAQTTSGFGGMMGAAGGRPGMGGAPGGGMAGGGRPSMASIMAMARGGNGAQHGLVLQLGSSRAPSGPPHAEHLPPAGLGAGDSLPLVTPQPAAAPAQRTEEDPQPPREYQKPRGRLLIFWGCGEHARPGQPLVIDFSKVAEGTLPPGFEALTRGLGVTPMRPPSPTRNKTYGEWPNAEARTTVPGEGSLVGQHVVRGDYSPEIRFALSPDQDFLAPLQFVTNVIGASGAGQLAWNPVPRAEAYFASAIGGGGGRGEAGDTAVFWTSSEVQASAFALPDYIAPGEIARLLGSHALMAPSQISCAVPKEAVDAAPHMFVQLAAYGGEANFSFPPRPADPKVAWNIEWTAKVRYKSQTAGILGMTMPGGRPGMGGDPRGGDPRAGDPRGQQQAPRRPGLGDIMKGLGTIPHP